MMWVARARPGSSSHKLKHKMSEQVYGLPTLMVFKDGKKMDGSHKEGAMPKKMIEQYLSKLGLSPAAVS